MKPRTSNTAACRIKWSARDGICWQTRRAYHTDRANQLARMFAANPRNREVRVIRIGPDTAFLRIYPNSLAGIYLRVMAAMMDRLKLEGAAYRYTRREDGAYDCHNPKSGQTYIVSADSCTCPQSQRAAMVGAPCKHRAGLSNLILPLGGRIEEAV